MNNIQSNYICQRYLRFS